MNEFFPEPKCLGRRVKVKLNLSDSLIKTDLKNAAAFTTSKVAKNVDLASLKSNVDKLDVDKLAPVLVDLSKLSDLAKKDVVTKGVHNGQNKNMDDKIAHITKLATNASFNAKTN